MNYEISYNEDIILIKIYNENKKKELEKFLIKEKKIYETYVEIDKEDLTEYYLFIIYRNLIKE